MRNVLLAAVFVSMFLSAGCRDSKSKVDKGQIDNLARKILLSMSSDKPQELYDESFSSEYKKKTPLAEWEATAKAYTERLGTMTDMVRINLNMTEINDCIEATVKYDVTWSKASGWLEMSISKADDQPWKIVQIFIRSDVISENSKAPELEQPTTQKAVTAPKVELPTGEEAPGIKPISE